MSPWLLLVLLGMSFSLFLIIPYFRRPRSAVLNRTEQNIEHYRQQWQTLESDFKAGKLDKDAYQQLRSELESALLVDTQDGTNRASQQNPSIDAPVPVFKLKKWPLVLMMFALLPGSLLVYKHLGASNEIRITELLNISAQRTLDPKEIKEVFERLTQELDRSPKDVELRFILARLYSAQGDYAKAANAFYEAFENLPPEAAKERAMALSQYAQSDFFANQQQLLDPARMALKQAIALNPEERTALGMLGIDAYSIEQYRAAIQYWRKLQSLVEPDANAQALENGIRKAIAELKSRGEDTSSLEMAEIQPKTTLDVAIQLDENLVPNLRGNETLFVYAKLADQPMPVAAKKIKKVEFPLNIQLTDLDSPMPSVKLSKDQEIIVTARISQGGGVKPVSGDLEGKSQAIKVDQNVTQVSILIDHLHP